MKSTVAKCAAEIRKVLKANFPGIKFSVRSSSFSMGDAVDISYTDYLPIKKVKAVISHYQYGSFNSMEDIYENSNSRDDIPQTKYLSVDRKMSEAVKNSLVKHIQETYSDCENLKYNDYYEHWCEYISTLVYRLFSDMSFDKDGNVIENHIKSNEIMLTLLFGNQSISLDDFNKEIEYFNSKIQTVNKDLIIEIISKYV